jgi:hypothetical protein
VQVHTIRIRKLSCCQDSSVHLLLEQDLCCLGFLLSTLLLDMKHDATDRFMRDSIRGCYCAERFLLLHHTMYNYRPEFSGNTVVRMFRPWSSVLDHLRRMTSPRCFILSKQVLHLVIQYPRRDKEEVENW